MFLIVTSFRENEFSNVSIHSKYIFSREKVGDCSQFNFTFLTDKYVPTEIRDITHISKIFIVKKSNTATVTG